MTGAVAGTRLTEWTESVLRAAGASEKAAHATATCLVDANRRGLDSHGVLMLAYYLPALLAGATDGLAEPQVAVDLPALALVDGKNALGAYVMTIATNLCCDKAERSGSAVVAVRDSSHFGAASCFSELAARRGCIAIVASNSDPGMAPLGALGPVLGTNPLAIAAPAPEGGFAPSLDIATSVVAHGRLTLAALAGTAIPDDWAIGPDGQPTTDPHEGLKGAVLPMAGHKGFALSFMLDVLCGCLSGAAVSPEITNDPAAPTPQRTGHFISAVHVGSIRKDDAYASDLHRLAEVVHNAPRRSDVPGFLLPGEREARIADARTDGIPFEDASIDRLRLLGQERGVAFPL